MEDRDMPTADANLLARMMGLDTGDEAPWNGDDLGAVFDHQRAASLEADLAGLRPGLRGLLAELNVGNDPPIATFGELLNHPRPPLELLELTKQFAKRCRNNPDGPLPDDIATVLYLATIAAARTRLATRITKLGDEGIRHGLRWAVRQPWLDAQTRGMLERACEAFGGSG